MHLCYINYWDPTLWKSYRLQFQRDFLIQQTFNFVTEWIRNKMTMSYYRENAHILHLPSQAKLPDLSILKTNTDNVYTESKAPAISLHKLDARVNTLQDQDLHLTKADKNRKDNQIFNKTLTNKMDYTDDILAIDSWFDDEIQSSMIFSFIYCIIAIIAFIFLLFLYYKHEKQRKILSFYLTSSNTAEAAMYTPSCHRNNIFLYLLSAVCLTLLLHVILRVLLWWYRQFCCYHTTLPFHCMHGHEKVLCYWAEQFDGDCQCPHCKVKVPITCLSVHNAGYLDYHVVSENWIYHFLKISKPIFLIHRDCKRPIRTPIFLIHRDCKRPIQIPTTFELGLLQRFKLRWILTGQYLATIVAFQNDVLIPLSLIQVCNYSLAISSPDNSVNTIASCPLWAVTSSGLYPTHAISQQAEPDDHVPTTDSTVNQSIPTISIQTPLDSTVVTHLNISDVWIS